MKTVQTALLACLVAAAAAGPHSPHRQNGHHRRQVVEQVVYQEPGAGPSSVNVPSSQPSGSGSQTSGKGDIKFPDGCLKANGFGIGANFDPGDDISSLKTAAGAPPCVVGSYCDITALDGISSGLKNADAAGAIYMLSLRTTEAVDTGPVISALNSMAKGRNGPPIWLRLGHEMNLYATTGLYKISNAQYISMFNAIANGVDRSKIKMFWNPNPGSDYKSWYPDAASVDIAGLDTYLMKDDSLYQQGLTPEFCSTYSKHPIFAGEIGAVPGSGPNSGDGGGTPAQRLNWATQAASAKVKSFCPSYIGFAWYEVSNGEGNFKAFQPGIMKQALTAASGGS